MAKARHAVLLAASFAAASIGSGQQKQNTTLSPLAFLTGRWVSDGRSEVQEENWSPVIGNSMTGSFRIVQSGKPVFYEFWAVEVDENRPVMKLKHFNAGLDGWEEKNVSTRMPLIANAENDAVFAEQDGSVSLHYHRLDNVLTCTVHHVRNGKSSDETFTLTKFVGP
jgi:hypothetical protein